MKQVLVTGALGVIGQYLTDFLKQYRYEVISTDLLVRDYTDYIRADVTSFEDLYRILKENSIETIIHLAGEVGRMVGEEHPQKMVYVNNVGTINIVRLCLDYGCKLVYFSTSEVYGKLLDALEEVNEENLFNGSPFMTTNIYALSKLFGEAIIKHYVDNYNLNAVTIRPFIIYGPGEYPSRYRSAISNFVYWALTGKKLTVHKGAKRAWCYISDFVEGVRLVMEHPFTGKYEAFNIGSDEYHTMEEVAKIIIDEVGGDYNQIQIVEPPDKFLILSKRASIEKIRKLGYEPKTTLREGIRQVVKWQRKEVLRN